MNVRFLLTALALASAAPVQAQSANDWIRYQQRTDRGYDYHGYQSGDWYGGYYGYPSYYVYDSETRGGKTKKINGITYQYCRPDGSDKPGGWIPVGQMCPNIAASGTQYQAPQPAQPTQSVYLDRNGCLVTEFSSITGERSATKDCSRRR